MSPWGDAVMMERGASVAADQRNAVRPSLQKRFRRTLKALQAPSRALKTALLFSAFVVIAVVAATFGPNPDLSHVKVTFVSGSEEGNYHAIVAKGRGSAAPARTHRQSAERRFRREHRAPGRCKGVV